jgi:hypothetical protein
MPALSRLHNRRVGKSRRLLALLLALAISAPLLWCLFAKKEGCPSPQTLVSLVRVKGRLKGDPNNLTFRKLFATMGTAARSSC